MSCVAFCRCIVKLKDGVSLSLRARTRESFVALRALSMLSFRNVVAISCMMLDENHSAERDLAEAEALVTIRDPNRATPTRRKIAKNAKTPQNTL